MKDSFFILICTLSVIAFVGFCTIQISEHIDEVLERLGKKDRDDETKTPPK